ncbi:MAG: fumarylacetoacetase [Candidatus Marinimicrobia bacterium]|nr:fumarylacetoacetase [Candidatus Neomarinimicrobiota bacterium]
MKSFIEYKEDSHFPIQNLPYGIFSSHENSKKRAGIAIGEFVLDLAQLEKEGLLNSNYFSNSTLNSFMSGGKKEWSNVRSQVQELLMDTNPTLRDNSILREKVFYKQLDVTMHIPANIGDYTDFYSSKNHATNVGAMFRDPENALLPNWLHLPVGYHGRSSSIVVSGTDIHRPNGQTMPLGSDNPVFGPCRLMDFELEMGCFVGTGNNLGEPISIENASEHLFGLVLVNDWSARDIQKWEYVPLGPFLAKNLATSISPWIIPFEALDEFRIENPIQENPTPLPYLQSNDKWTFDMKLEVQIKTEKMENPETICNSNYKYMYWNLAQQLAHHTITGCNMNPGDMFASGTISGEESDSYGSMLELAWKGTMPIQLSNGEKRKFIQDNDEIIMTGYAQGKGYRVGFGEVKGKILSAK